MITLESQKLSESRAGPAGVMHGARASAQNMCRAALLATGSLSSACADTILRKCSEVVCVVSPHVDGNLSGQETNSPQTVFSTQWHSVLAYLLTDIPKHCILSSKRFSNLSSTYFPMDSYCLDTWVNLYWLLFNADS